MKRPPTGGGRAILFGCQEYATPGSRGLDHGDCSQGKTEPQVSLVNVVNPFSEPRAHATYSVRPSPSIELIPRLQPDTSEEFVQ